MNGVSYPGQTPDGRIASAQKDEEIRVLRQQNAALLSLAQSAKEATENAKKAAEASDKAAKQSKKISVIATIAAVFSALGSILSGVFAALGFFA